MTDKVTDDERTLLLFLIEDPGYTVSQLSEKMEVSRKTVAQKNEKTKRKRHN